MSFRTAQCLRAVRWTDCQPLILLEWSRKIQFRNFSSEIQSFPFCIFFMHSETFYFALELWCCRMEGSKCGELQSCHLGTTCFRNHRCGLSLHSTHGNAIHSTHRHAALEISFVPWSHWGLKKDQWGNLIQSGSGNCQWQAWEFAPVMN